MRGVSKEKGRVLLLREALVQWMSEWICVVSREMIVCVKQTEAATPRS